MATGNPAVRADLLEKLGRKNEAATEYRRAAGMTRNEAERKLMTRRAAQAPRNN